LKKKFSRSNVNLTKRVNTSQGKRYCPVVVANNGRVKPDWVSVDGNLERHLEGSYYLDWTESGKRKRVAVGRVATEAWALKTRQEAELAARAQGIQIVDETSKRVRVNDAVACFLEEMELKSEKVGSYKSYKQAIDYFLEFNRKTYIDEIERRDMLFFTAFLREKKLAQRTIANKFQIVMIFLKGQGRRGFLTRKDWPRYVLKEPEVYEREVLDRVLAAGSPRDQLIFNFFLMTGFRDKEVGHLTWRHVDFKGETVSVRANERFQWFPKSWEERTVPVPTQLVEMLKTAKGTAAPDDLVFPNSKNEPDDCFLYRLRRAAELAGFDPDADNFILHRFRATFATWHLRGTSSRKGFDLRTVMAWLGHKDIKSTMRYLEPDRGETVRDRISATFA
jgi:integrase/recombinase XerD